MPYKDPQKRKEYMQRYYLKNRDKIKKNAGTPERLKVKRERAARDREMMRGWLRKVKEDSGCIDCSGNFPHFVLEFDHSRGSKLFGINTGSTRTRASGNRLEIEMNKCDIVCANCHKTRTWSRYHGSRGDS